MNADKGRNFDAVQVFADFLSGNGRRHTPERSMVLAAVQGMKGHFNADDVAAELQARGDRVALATVYATVPLLAEAGILQRHVFGERTLYEYSQKPHSHAVCTCCGRVRDLRLPVLEQQTRTLRIPRFTPTKAAITVYGLCAKCNHSGRRKSSKNLKSIK